MPVPDPLPPPPTPVAIPVDPSPPPVAVPAAPVVFPIGVVHPVGTTFTAPPEVPNVQ